MAYPVSLIIRQVVALYPSSLRSLIVRSRVILFCVGGILHPLPPNLCQLIRFLKWRVITSAKFIIVVLEEKALSRCVRDGKERLLYDILYYCFLVSYILLSLIWVIDNIILYHINEFWKYIIFICSLYTAEKKKKKLNFWTVQEENYRYIYVGREEDIMKELIFMNTCTFLHELFRNWIFCRKRGLVNDYLVKMQVDEDHFYLFS